MTLCPDTSSLLKKMDKMGEIVVCKTSVNLKYSCDNRRKGQRGNALICTDLSLLLSEMLSEVTPAQLAKLLFLIQENCLVALPGVACEHTM